MKISLNEICDLVPRHIFQRGKEYYDWGRVYLLETGPDYFRAIVTGTQDYFVEVEKEQDWLYAECSCPYWDDCKHIVAALLAAKDFYDHATAAQPKGKESSSWKAYLEQIARYQEVAVPLRPKWQLVYILSLEGTAWSLRPQKAFIRKDGRLGALSSVDLESLAEPQLARHRNDEVVLRFLETWKRNHSFYYYPRYSVPGSCRFKYGEKVGVLLDLLRQSEVYFSDGGDLGTRLTFSEQQGAVEFRLEDGEGHARLRPYLLLGQQEIPVDKRLSVLSSEPTWILKEDTLIEVAKLQNGAFLVPFTQTQYDLTIPREEVAQFLDSITSQVDLFENIRLPEGARSETVQEISEKRLYLEEDDEGVLVKLRFLYGSVEVHLNDSRRTLWGSGPEPNRFVKVIRNFEQEAEALQELQETRVKLHRDGNIITRKNKALEWLLEDVPKLLASGFVVFGEESLRRYKVTRTTAQVRVAVESGIDWFDLKMEIDFGGVLLSLKELRKALSQKRRYVKLADGSIAQIPRAWLNRFRHVMNLAETQEERLRLSQLHVTLIDELFAEASQKAVDEPYRKRLQQLRNFDGIKEQKVPSTFKGTLRPYQKAGYNWLCFLREFNFGGCLADDMGLGKTIQALTLLLSEHKQNGAKDPSLIVTPTSVVFNWMAEIERFAPSLRVYNQTGVDRDRTKKRYDEYDVVLTSYGTLRRDILFLKDVPFNYVILDESQYIKNPLSQTAKAVRLLQARHRLALTGTPVENSTIELWSLFSFLNPGLLGNLNYFKGAFARPIEQSRDPEAAELLRKLVFPFILRRTKDEVEKDLPPKVENLVYCEMSPPQKKLYNHWRDYYRAALLKQISEVGLDRARMNVLEGLTKLRQIACHPLLVEDAFHGSVGKYEMLLEYLNELLAEGHKVLLFSQFVKMLTIVRKYLDSAQIPYEYLDGKTRDRKTCVERFQNDEACKIFLISLRAGGTGLNLTAADYVIHYDPWWNPAVEAQATDRTHRIGQNKHVLVYKMITKETVEEKILQLQERKKELASNIITTEAGLFKQLTAEDIKVLFS